MGFKRLNKSFDFKNFVKLTYFSPTKLQNIFYIVFKSLITFINLHFSWTKAPETDHGDTCAYNIADRNPAHCGYNRNGIQGSVY